MKVLEGIEPIVKLLVVLIVFFTAIIIYCEHAFHEDGQVFQVFSNVLSGAVGALLMYVKGKVDPSPEKGRPDVPHA